MVSEPHNLVIMENPPEHQLNQNHMMSTIKNYNNRLHDKIPARVFIYLMSTSGFIVSYMMRNDINIAILAMVKNQNKSNVENVTQQYCLQSSNTTSNTDEIMDYGGTLEWSLQVQSYVLSSFFWIYPMSQIVGGVATHKYGAKRVFGYAQLVTALTNVFIPVASETHYGLVILIKLIQGLISGFTWPATFEIVAHWAPLSERSLFMTCFQGYNIGIGLSYVLGGFIISNFGWKTLFYTTSSIGFLWCVLWYFLAYPDSPENHPRISSREKQYLKENKANIFSNRRKHVPWCSILRSMPVWSNSIAGFGRVWVVFTFMVYGPQYMKHILGFNIKINGVTSGASYLCCYLTSLVFSSISDKIISKRMCSLTITRKIFTALSQVVPGLLCILIGFLGCNITAVVVAWFTAVVMVPAVDAGPMANVVDMAPNFSGLVGGLTQTILLLSSPIGPLLAGYLIRDGHTLPAWQTIFNIAGGVSIGTYVLFHIWGTSEIQKWNYEKDKRISTPETQLMVDKCKADHKHTLC